MLEFFLSQKLDPNKVSDNGSSPLHWAVWRMNLDNEELNKTYIECIKILLKAGADKSLKTAGDKTAAVVAAEKGLTKIAALLKP